MMVNWKALLCAIIGHKRGEWQPTERAERLRRQCKRCHCDEWRWVA
jgi:hypothetical protein